MLDYPKSKDSMADLSVNVNGVESSSQSFDSDEEDDVRKLNSSPIRHHTPSISMSDFSDDFDDSYSHSFGSDSETNKRKYMFYPNPDGSLSEEELQKLPWNN